jgi:endonuclease YncB( thermonuclease family)
MKRFSSKYLFKIILPLVVAAAAIVSSKLPFQKPADGEYRVTKVIDGDTVEINTGERLRYIGIDTPETHRKTALGWTNVTEPFGKEAERLNAELVLGKAVRIEEDVTKRDKYQRRLGYCFVAKDGQEVFVAEELLRRGVAYLYTFPPNVKYVDRLVRAWSEAKEKRAGLWSVDLEIRSADAAKYLGQRKIVLGRIRNIKSTSKTILMFLDGLTAVIFKKDLDMFLNDGIRPQDAYRDRNVRIFGLIKMYEGKPEVIVSHPSQIEIL